MDRIVDVGATGDLTQKRDTMSRIWILLLTSVSAILSLSSLIADFVEPQHYHTAEIAKSSVLATRDFVLEDEVGTEEKRTLAESDVRRVFVLDDRDNVRPSVRIETLFGVLSSMTEQTPSGERVVGAGTDAQKSPPKRVIEDRFGLELTAQEWETLADPVNWKELKDVIRSVVDSLLEKGILASKRPLATALSKYGAVVVRRSSDEEQPILSVESLYDLDEATEVLEASLSRSSGSALESLSRKIARSLLRPNVVFDSQETERRIRLAREQVEPIFFQVKRGEVVARAGEQITPLQARKLARISELKRGAGGAGMFIAYFVLTNLMILTVYFFLARFRPRFFKTTRDLWLHCLTLVGSFLLLKFTSVVSNAVALSFGGFSTTAFALATPFAAGGMLLQVTLGPTATLFFTMIFALLSGIFLEDMWLIVVLIVIGNIIGALSVTPARRRSVFLLAAIRVAFANTIITLCYILLFTPLTPAVGVAQVICAFCGGLLSGVLAAALTPVAEFIGGYVTDIKLLELASLDRPLLRELSVQAPGTWNHSMVIGQLGEAAAEAIGANPLLTRVGAYYHDIGKIKKPAYFVENQGSKENRHDKLPPSMSALIIRSHVKDGVELAEEHKVPQQLIDFIPQHHGTALIEYFYDKALREAGEGDLVDDSLYRYPGPKPQTKEAGILMLSDHVEASSRVLPDPTPARIQGMVQKIINKIFASGQLDECELTLRDLHLIAKGFTRVLSGIFHKRIEYAEPVEKGRTDREEGHEQHKDEHAKPNRSEPETFALATPGSGVTEEIDRADSQETLRRLGIEPH